MFLNTIAVAHFTASSSNDLNPGTSNQADVSVNW